MAWLSKRLIFYGLLILAGLLFSTKLKVSIQGKDAALFFLAFSAVSGALQSMNIWLIRKIGDFDKLENLGFWTRERLKDRLAPRRDAAFSRATIGLIASLLVGLGAGYMKYLDSLAVPAWLLSISGMFVAISAILLFVALYEFHLLTRLESDLLWKARQNESKEKALSSIRGEGENKS